MRRRLESAREPAVVLAHDRRRELGDDRLADALVEDLDHLAPVADTGANEATRAEEGEDPVRAPLRCPLPHLRWRQGPGDR